jgi:ABC-type lipoprotein export system ATPase subunit
MNDAEMSSFRARTIGFVFQFQSMLSTLTVLENVLLPSLFAGTQADPAAALDLLDMVGMKKRAAAYAHQLSIGQQRRVSIVRALMNKPVLLLCDEPTGDLDPDSESVIMNLLTTAHRQGATIVMVTHNHGLCSHATKVYSCHMGSLTVK